MHRGFVQHRRNLRKNAALNVRFPKAMKIAVCISGNRFFIGKGKSYNGSFACRKTLALAASVGLEIDPLDAVLFRHGMLRRTDLYFNGVALYSNHRNMLFCTGLYCSGIKRRHFLAAAHNRHPGVVDQPGQITAMPSNIKSVFTHRAFSYPFMIIWIQVL